MVKVVLLYLTSAKSWKYFFNGEFTPQGEVTPIYGTVIKRISVQ